MEREKKLKIRISFVIICILIISLLLYIGILLIQNGYISASNIPKEKLNFNKIYEMKLSDNFKMTIESSDEFYFEETTNLIYNENNAVQLWVQEIKYNFENYHAEYYGNKYIDKITNFKKINKEKPNSLNTEVYQIDGVYNDENLAEEVNGFYFIKTEDLMIVMNVYYENQRLYSEYKEIITHMVTNMQVTDSNDMSEYMKMANDKSSLYLSYDELTEIEKEKYNEIYRILFQENKTIILEEYSEEYHLAAKALKNDAVYYDLEHYNICMTMKIGEEVELNVIEREKEIILEDFNNSKNKNKYIEIEAVYEKNYINLIFDKNIYGTDWEILSITDEEIEILKNKVNKIINNMPSDLSNYGKYKYLAESVCELTEYAYEELENGTMARTGNILGVFIDGRAVCQGYANTFSYLCKKVGLYCNDITVPPLEDGEPHIFNYIKIGNKYYFVDTTWMDGENESEFAFIYDDNIPNGHNSYIQWVYQNTYPKIEETLQDLKDNLGKNNWYELQKIF